jgi:hypothetical protein
MFDGCRVPLAISGIQTPNFLSGMNLAMYKRTFFQTYAWVVFKVLFERREKND